MVEERSVSVDDISYEQLREVQKRERSTGMLSELPEDFYLRVGALIAKMRGDMNANFGLEKAREYENALKVARDVYSVREQKILLRALRAARGTNNVVGLTNEEKEVFEQVREVVAKGEAGFESILGVKLKEIKGEEDESGHELAPPPAPALGQALPMQEQPEDSRKLRVLSAIPQFMGVDGNKYGPFKVGELIFLPAKVAELLLKRRMVAEA